MEQYLVLFKNDFNEFIERLAKIRKLVAPVKSGEKSYIFEEVTKGEEVSYNYIPTILPPKKYFMPQNETIVEYEKKINKWETVLYSEELILFGVHTCDLAGIQCLNLVFSERPNDVHYIIRKKKILIIGLECTDYCDDYATCGLMDNHNANGGYDLLMTELADRYIIHVNTFYGEELMNNLAIIKNADDESMEMLNQVRERKRHIFKPEINITHNNLKPLFEKSFHSKVWDDIHERCLSCGNCTNVCPTCYCYDIEDEIDLDFNKGKLIRKWDSCQSRPFAMISGGENFRPERGSRQRHRYMRKFNYPFEKYNRYFCTGCGRCSRTCMAEINLKETITTLVEE